MTDAPAANADQHAYWNSHEGEHWVDAQARYDVMLAPFGDALLEVAAIASGEQVLDVGCGTGPTTCQAASRATDGHAHGVDISAPMIAAAEKRAAAAGITNATFAVADAQTAAFGPVTDVLISRFGVMFFDDPVAAFANLRDGLRPTGRAAFVCWQPLLVNEWMTVPAFAAAPYVGVPTPPTDPYAPGPFAFCDAGHVRDVLSGAGFSDIEIDPFETTLLMAGGGQPDEVAQFLKLTGMGRTLFGDAPDQTVDAALGAISEALAPHAGPDGIRLPAATWLVRARA